MYKTERDRLNKKIDEENISLSAKRDLHNLVGKYFSVTYQNISKNRKDYVERTFKLDCIVILTRCRIIDSINVKKIFGQIEHSLFTILDRYIDKTRKSKLENNSEDQSRAILVIRGLIRGIPYLGDAIDASFFGKR